MRDKSEKLYCMVWANTIPSSILWSHLSTILQRGWENGGPFNDLLYPLLCHHSQTQESKLPLILFSCDRARWVTGNEWRNCRRCPSCGPWQRDERSRELDRSTTRTPSRATTRSKWKQMHVRLLKTIMAPINKASRPWNGSGAHHAGRRHLIFTLSFLGSSSPFPIKGF